MIEKEKTEITAALDIDDLAQKYEPCLIVMSGKDLGQQFKITKSQVILGRSSEADVLIKEQNISRQHVKIIVLENSVVIEDLGSTNGTYVNSERITKTTLQDGDLISIGKTVLRYTLQSNIDRAFHDEIYQSATGDELTTLFNRKYFQKHIESEFSRAVRYGRALTLILIDLDNFKKVNDVHGHPAGDLVLREVGKIVKACVRRSIDIPARYGGEEIAILLPETNVKQGKKLADNIRESVEALEMNYEGKILRITASIGVADNMKDVTTFEELIQRCDEKLYEAKASGKNRVVVA